MRAAEIVQRATCRREAVIGMRNDGMTYAEIGEMMGVTSVRARQIYEKAKQLREGKSKI